MVDSLQLKLQKIFKGRFFMQSNFMVKVQDAKAVDRNKTARDIIKGEMALLIPLEDLSSRVTGHSNGVNLKPYNLKEGKPWKHR
jgi:hypothetical protein